MDTLEFLARLNTATTEWGLWIDRDCPTQHHIGHYSFEHDLFPRRFIHVGTLAHLAHLRQKYILDNCTTNSTDEELGRIWAERFLAQWQTQSLATA